MTKTELQVRHRELVNELIDITQQYNDLGSPFKVGDVISNGDYEAVVEGIKPRSLTCLTKPDIIIRKRRKNGLAWAMTTTLRWYDFDKFKLISREEEGNDNAKT